MGKVTREPDDAAHMLDGHGVTVDQANEAVNDEGAIWYDPDPASKSGAVGSRRRVIAVAPGDRHRDLATRR